MTIFRFNPGRVIALTSPDGTRTLSTSSACCYKGSWVNPRRLQNPELVKKMPTYEFVNPNNMKRSNMLYSCGLGATGSLGLQKFYQPEKMSIEQCSTKDVSSPTFRRVGVFSLSDKLVDVACGYGFTIVAAQVRDSSHTALGFGFNSHSQIGYHVTRPGYPLEIVSTPSAIVLPTTTPIKKVACGRSHSLLLNSSGQVFSLGNNSLGQCGRPILKDEIYFGSKKCHLITGLPNNIVSVHCGQDHSMFLTDDGELFSCGWGADGQTGLGHYDNQHKPARIKGAIEGVKIVKVSTYADTVLALDDKGNVFGWGNSEYSQFRVLAKSESEQFNEPRHLELGVPGRIVEVAAGGTICAVLNDRGQVFVWGFGILGLGPRVDHSSRPKLIPESLFGKTVYNPDVKVERIYASLSHFAAINSQGDLLTWGKNRGSALGFAHSNDQYFPMRVSMNQALVKKVALGVDHSCAIVEKVC